MLLCTVSPTFGFMAARRSPAVARAAEYESGKVNVGVEVMTGEGVAPPAPLLECDKSCVDSIFACVEEGCSVESMMKLDEKLAADEKKVAETITELEKLVKTEPVPEVGAQIAWYKNFLSR